MSKTLNLNAVLKQAARRIETADTAPFVIVRREDLTLAELVTAEVGADNWADAMRTFHATARRGIFN